MLTDFFFKTNFPLWNIYWTHHSDPLNTSHAHIMTDSVTAFVYNVNTPEQRAHNLNNNCCNKKLVRIITKT